MFLQIPRSELRIFVETSLDLFILKFGKIVLKNSTFCNLKIRWKMLFTSSCSKIEKISSGKLCSRTCKNILCLQLYLKIPRFQLRKNISKIPRFYFRNFTPSFEKFNKKSKIRALIVLPKILQKNQRSSF